MRSFSLALALGLLGLGLLGGDAAIAVDLEEATPRLEDAAEAIYEGLDKTQQEIGKTEARKAAIEHGRDRATGKLEGLLDRVESADSLDDLSDTDQLTIKRLSQ